MVKKILFVDDDKDWNLIVESCLRESGYEVISAKSASEAMALIDQSQLDLLILGLKPTAEDNLGLMQCLRANQPAVPVVFYGTLPAGSDAIPSATNDAHLYLQKGDMEELVEAVQMILTRTKPGTRR